MKKLIFLNFIPLLLFAQENNLAPEKWDNPKEIKIITNQFPDGVNSPYISSDGQQLYFEFNSKIYLAEKKDSVWLKPDLINANISGFNPIISRNGNKLFFIKRENDRNKIYFIERGSKEQPWFTELSCGSNINNDSTIIDEYYLPNDTTIIIRRDMSMYVSNYEKHSNQWKSLIKSTEYPYDFFPGNFNGTFINSNLSKVYHVSLQIIWYEQDGHLIDILKRTLSVRYKNIHMNWFGSEYTLNINGKIDSLFNPSVEFQSYFVQSPSLTENGKTMFLSIRYNDTTRVYYSRMLIDENGNVISAIKNDKELIPTSYYLSQNYPNSFNPITKIKYSVPKSSHISIRVFDVLGNEIAALVNQFQNAGNYEIEFNADHLPSGVYFYQLVAENIVLTKKLLLLK